MFSGGRTPEGARRSVSSRAAASRRVAAVCTSAAGIRGRPSHHSPYSAPLSGCSTEPTALRIASAPTVTPDGSTVLAEPTPPLTPPATAPVPAPTFPCDRVGARGDRGLTAQRGVRTGPPVAAAAQVEDARRRHDRHHLLGTGADSYTAALFLQPGRDTRGGVQPVGAAAGQHDRVDALHQRARLQGVGLPGARAAAAHVDGRQRAALRRQHHRRARQPPVAHPLGVSHQQAAHIRHGVHAAHAYQHRFFPAAVPGVPAPQRSGRQGLRWTP